MTGKSFSNPNADYVVTRQVSEKIPLQIPVFVKVGLLPKINDSWEEVDYLLVIEFFDSEGQQGIHVYQEKPSHHFHATVDLKVLVLDKPLEEKLWLIDDGAVQTLLFPDDY